MTQVDHGAGEAPSDAELILQVRSGDREAFGTLYTRHAAAARALARQYVKPGDAEDVVADAFGKLYEMLRRGAGPDSGFRTYLYTVVRHRAYDVSRGATRMRPAEDAEIEAALGRVASSEDPALQGFERSVVSRAYFGLPERWREVLWYCLVDDLKPAQIAPVLGLTPNGVSALLYRAKDALRDGYLQQHLTHAPSDTCRAVNPHLGGYVRDSLSRREKARIEAHLSTCGTCSALVLELADVAHGMKCVVAPLVLGAAGLALVGSAIPVGASLAAAVKAASAGGFAGTSAGGSAGGAVGSAAAGGSGMGVGATSAAGAGTTTAAGAGTTAAVGSGAGAAASAGASAAGVAGATAGATAVGVVGAGGAAATGGAAVAGAITVATVGMVAALQMMGTQAEAEPEGAPVVASSPDASVLASPGPTASAESPVPPEDDAAEPVNLLPLAEDFTLSFAGAGDPLQPRQAQDVVLTLANHGAAEATGTTVRLTLPDGMTMAAQDAPSGAGFGSAIVDVDDEPSAVDDEVPAAGKESGDAPVVDADALIDKLDLPVLGSGDGSTEAGSETGGTRAAAGEEDTGNPASSDDPVEPVRTLCTPGSEPGVLLCDIGVLGAGETRQVQATVRARAGGSYSIGAELRADDIAATAVALPPRKVESFGPELTAQVEAAGLMSPGRGLVPLRIGNTGDEHAASGWSMAVTLPDGIRPAAEQEALVCTAVESRTWSCVAGEPTGMDPGGWRELPLSVVALPNASAGVAQSQGMASVAPLGVPHAQDARAQVTVTSAWAGAAYGVGALAAKCVASGGLTEAKAEIAGTYTNTTPGNVLVALEAAGGTVSHADPLAPGQSVTLRRDEGIRVPGGSATWVLSRAVEGTTHEYRVAAGELSATDCYDPKWDATAEAATVNAGGRVGVRGALVNASDEPMSVKMVVEAKSGRLVSETRTVAPGDRQAFLVATEHKRLDAGAATFQLVRWTFDKDGDPPAGPAQPGTRPKATYERAVIAPSYSPGHQTMSAECTYDGERGASMGTFRVPVDNTMSTLPVTFRFGGAMLTVPAGGTGAVEARVPWGTGKLPLLTSGETLGEIDVEFASCARLDWPADSVEAHLEAQCVDGQVEAVADLRNTSAVTWRGGLLRSSTGQYGEEADVPADGTVRLVLPGLSPPVDDSVLVRLSREFEGALHTVERSYDVTAAVCDPAPECREDSDAASWFTALFGRKCTEEPEDTADEWVEQVGHTSFAPPAVWRGVGGA